VKREFLDPLGRTVRFSWQGGRLVHVECEGWATSGFAVRQQTISCVVYGDLHGRIREALSSAQEMLRDRGIPIHGYFQVGDLGAFDDRSVLDDMTRNLARKDPAILGFRDFLGMDGEELDHLLGGGGAFVPRFLFIEGNHDDLEYLRDRHPLHPLSYSLVFLESGETERLTVDATSLEVGGLGWSCERGDVRRIAAARPQVVLAHALGQLDGWADYAPGDGHLCLFGHDSEAYRLSQPERGWFGLEHFHTDRSGAVREGCWGLVLADGDRVEFTYLPPAF